MFNKYQLTFRVKCDVIPTGFHGKFIERVKGPFPQALQEGGTTQTFEWGCALHILEPKYLPAIFTAYFGLHCLKRTSSPC